MDEPENLIAQMGDRYERLRAVLAQRIVGLDEVIDLLCVAILSGGHCLLQGVPGLAKTTLIEALAGLFDLRFSRIQFTPDLMPSDICGTEVISDREGERGLRFLRGPVFANVVLADEINRTPPKTQAALMEAMEERQVTIGGQQHPLEAPFFVLATQNPIEQEGTYPLPAAQLDRFAFQLDVPYPSRRDEHRILRLTTTNRTHQAETILGQEEVLSLIRAVRSRPAPPAILELGRDLARRSRPDQPDAPPAVREFVAWGAGPRAAQWLVQGAKTLAMLEGRTEPTPDDCARLLAPTFRHRLVRNFRGAAEGVGMDEILREVRESVGLGGGAGLSARGA